jgi:RND family efflux transporter MFP subunit
MSRVRVRETAAIGAVLVLFGAALSGCGAGGPEAPLKAAEAPRAVPVTVAPASRRSVERTIQVVGTLKGWEDVTVGSKKEGRVLKVLHDMGDRVKPGELLVVLDTEGADLAVEQARKQLQAELAKLGLKDLPGHDFDPNTVPAVVSAQAKLAKAKQLLGRERSLIQRNAGTLQDFQNAENDERAAEADLANAVLTVRSTLANVQAAKVRIDVARHDRAEMEVRTPVPTHPPAGVTSPLTYAVAKRSVTEGQMLKVGDPVVQLVIETPLRLWANVPERHSAEVRNGQPVRLTVASFPGEPFEGTVSRINPSVDPVSRTFQVEALVPNNRGLLRPGGFAKASVLVDRNAEATAVPIEAVVKFAGVTKLFVVEGSKARAVNVETGLEGSDWVEVIGRLPEKAQVVTTGQTHLAEGTPVEVRKP